MQEIQPSLLWIGNAGDLNEPTKLFGIGIAAVVDVAMEEPISRLPRALVYCRFPLIDGGGNDRSVLRQAVQTTADLITADKRTLVACSAGMSRSPTIALFALAIFLGESPTALAKERFNTKTLELNGPLWNDLSKMFPQ